MSDVSFLTKEFRKEFSYDGNVNVVVTFQWYDHEWDEMVDLDPDSRINDKDKLTAVVAFLLSIKLTRTCLTSIFELHATTNFAPNSTHVQISEISNIS